MSKLYFEMNDKEKQLNLIAGNLDYAYCVFSEGLSGTGKFNLENEEVRKLQNRIGDHVMKAYEDINTLLKAVEEKENYLLEDEVEERHGLVFNVVGGAEELNIIKDCKVYHIEEIENPEESYYGTQITLFNENTGKYIDLIKDDDGELSMSQWY